MIKSFSFNVYRHHVRFFIVFFTTPPLLAGLISSEWASGMYRGLKSSAIPTHRSKNPTHPGEKTSGPNYIVIELGHRKALWIGLV